jgi:cell division GTPase FtsZ
MVCVDFAHVRMLFAHSGTARAGCGWASGAHRTSTAIQRALTDPWLDAATLARAKRVLITVTGSPGLTLYDIHKATAQVQTLLSEEACFIFGGLIEAQAPPETMQVMIVAGGLDADAGATSTGWT